MRPLSILLIAGLLVWALAGMVLVNDLVSHPEPRTWGRLAAWLVFGAAFLGEGFWPRGIDVRASVAVQTLSVLVLVSASRGDGIEFALFVMIAGQLPFVFPMQTCLVWVVVQTLLAFLPHAGNGRPLQTTISAFAYLSFQLFAVGAAGLADSERRAREELAGANGRLEAVQERLADTTREAERLRIARELHDSLGHHLTALALDLELARHFAKEEAMAPVERARALASSLMSELREAVTELRADSGGDLVARLQALARPDGQPRVEVEIDGDVGEVPSGVARALARVAQEVVTNATRHSGASILKLALRARDSDWILEGRDDGVGADRTLGYGHGLSGMRERIEGIGGVLLIDARPGRGFAVTATVPKGARA